MLSTKVVIAKPARPRGPGSAGTQPARSADAVGPVCGCRPMRSRVEMVALSMDSPSHGPASSRRGPPDRCLLTHQAAFPAHLVSNFTCSLAYGIGIQTGITRGRLHSNRGSDH